MNKPIIRLQRQEQENLRLEAENKKLIEENYELSVNREDIEQFKTIIHNKKIDIKRLKAELEQYKASKQASYESMQREWNYAINTLRDVKVENEKLKAENEELKKAKDEYYLNNLSYEIKLSELAQTLAEERDLNGKCERKEGYILHYDREDIYCKCQICKEESHNFYEIYEPSIRLNTDIPLMKDVFRDKYFICEKCMKNDKSLQYRYNIDF